MKINRFILTLTMFASINFFGHAANIQNYVRYTDKEFTSIADSINEYSSAINAYLNSLVEATAKLEVGPEKIRNDVVISAIKKCQASNFFYNETMNIESFAHANNLTKKYSKTSIDHLYNRTLLKYSVMIDTLNGYLKMCNIVRSILLPYSSLLQNNNVCNDFLKTISEVENIANKTISIISNGMKELSGSFIDFNLLVNIDAEVMINVKNQVEDIRSKTKTAIDGVFNEMNVAIPKSWNCIGSISDFTFSVTNDDLMRRKTNVVKSLSGIRTIQDLKYILEAYQFELVFESGEVIVYRDMEKLDCFISIYLDNILVFTDYGTETEIYEFGPI